MKDTTEQTVKRVLDNSAIAYAEYNIGVDYKGLVVNSGYASKDKKILMVFTKEGTLVSMEPLNS